MIKLNSLSIGRRVNFGFSVVVAIVIVLGVTAISQLRVIRAKSEQIIGNELPKMMTLDEIETTVKANYINTLQHIDATTPEAMAGIEKEMKAKTAALTELYKKVDPNPSLTDEVAIMEAIKPARNKYRDLREKVLSLSRDGKKIEATEAAQNELYPVFLQYSSLILAAVEYHDKLGSAAAAESTQAVNFSEKVVGVGVGSAVLLSIVISFVIGRTTRKDLSEAANELASSSEAVNAAALHVNNASQSLAKGATDQAATLEETSASLEEISSMTSRNAEAASRANQIAGQTRSAAEGGAEDMGAMMGAMDQIKASSDNIAKIIKTIDEIAFQTNLLALNAAVEAARAGEAGAGFAVVAEEVRALAQRSAQAAKDTAEKIDDSIKKSEHGVQLSKKVADSLTAIVGRAREVDTLITEIARASSEQAQGVSQVVKAVHQIDTVTQTNAATAEESAAAAEELNAQVIAMDELVSTVKHLAGLRKAAAANHAAAVEAGFNTSDSKKTHEYTHA